MWKARNTRTKGKSTLLGAQIIPIILYAASVIFLPPQFIIDIQDLCYAFVWPSGKYMVERKSYFKLLTIEV